MSDTAATPLPSEFKYRKGSIEDKEGLKELSYLSYKEYAGVLTPDNWETLKSIIRNEEELTKLINKAQIFVCTHNEDIIGMAHIVPCGYPTHIFKSEWSYIRKVGVHPQYRGLGIAKILTNMCINHAKQTHEKIIALHTSDFMDAARHIYESIGFTRLKEIDPMFGKRYWLYTLEI